MTGIFKLRPALFARSVDQRRSLRPESFPRIPQRFGLMSRCGQRKLHLIRLKKPFYQLLGYATHPGFGLTMVKANTRKAGVDDYVQSL